MLKFAAFLSPKSLTSRIFYNQLNAYINLTEFVDKLRENMLIRWSCHKHYFGTDSGISANTHGLLPTASLVTIFDDATNPWILVQNSVTNAKATPTLQSGRTRNPCCRYDNYQKHNYSAGTSARKLST